MSLVFISQVSQGKSLSQVVELEDLGVLTANNPTGISAPKQPHLVNLREHSKNVLIFCH